MANPQPTISDLVRTALGGGALTSGAGGMFDNPFQIKTTPFDYTPPGGYGNYPTPSSTGGPKGAYYYEPAPNGDTVLWVWSPENGIYVPQSVMSPNYGPGGGSSTPQWRSGEYELQVRQLDISQRQMELQNEQATLDRDLQRAIQTGDLELRRQVEARQAQNAQDQLQLSRDQMAVQNEQAGRQLAASIYSTQMGTKANLANTIAGLTTQAAQWSGNPRDVFSYLKLMGAQGQTPAPYSTATAGQNTEYRDNLTGAFNSIFQPAMGKVNTLWDEASQTPEGAKAWYENLPSYTGASQSQQALFRSLPLSQQQALANATPQQVQAGGKLAPQRSPSDQTDMTNYNNLIAGKFQQDIDAINRYLAAQRPPSMAGGGKMTINEPAGIVGLSSGKLHATIAEFAPETVTITPQKGPRPFAAGGTININSYDPVTGGTVQTPSLRNEARFQRDPGGYISPVSGARWGSKAGYDYQMAKNADQRKRSADAIARAQKGDFSGFGGFNNLFGGKGGKGRRHMNLRPDAKAMEKLRAEHPEWMGRAAGGAAGGAGGGTATGKPVDTAPLVDNSPEGQLARALATALQNQGVNWGYTPGQGYAPTARLLAPSIQQIAQKFPTLFQTILAGRSASGQSPEDFAAELATYTPSAVKVW